MNDVEIVLRAGEIAAAALSPLARIIYEELSGKSEADALRAALARLAARPDLTPVLPAVRAMIAARRAEDEDGS